LEEGKKRKEFLGERERLVERLMGRAY